MAQDLTRYTINFGDACFSNLTKRGAVLKFITILLQNGRTPHDIEAAASWRKSRLIFVVPGTLDPASFSAAATDQARRTQRVFDPVRWHLRDNELVHAGGQTIAVSNQWGKGKMVRLLTDLEKIGGGLSLSFRADG